MSFDSVIAHLPLLPAIILSLVFSSACSGKRQPEGKENNPSAHSPEWQEFFDGKSLAGWRRLDLNGTGGEIDVTDGRISFGRGNPLTAMVIADKTFAPPAAEYEMILQARKTDGRDFFCALTFPVPERGTCCTFVAGGWGGGVTGISNIDNLDANRNSTRSVIRYHADKWYDLKVEVRRGRIRCWVNQRLVVNALIAGKSISMRDGEIEKCQPLGIASFSTASEFKSLRIRALPAEK
jgi:hypothetical protein